MNDKIGIILSTMHQSDYSLLEKIGLECDAVVVNQCDEESAHSFNLNGHRITWINSTDRGLSKSRNLAIAKSTADICLLVDDDEILHHGYADIISNAFARHPEADLIGFQVKGIESVFKEYSGQEGEVSYIRSMRMASVEIAFRRESMINKGIKFNEHIGAGTKYKMGEENALLFACLSQGLKIYYVPECIGSVHIGGSTWFDGFNDDYFLARGAVFTAMSRRWSIALIIQFAIRKYSLYRDYMNISRALCLMCRGRKEYLQQHIDK